MIATKKIIMKLHCWIVLLVLGVTTVNAQSKLVLTPRYQSHTNDGKVTVVAIAYGNKKMAIEAAKEAVFQTLLFNGLSDAPKPRLKQALVKDEIKATQNHPDFFNQLFDQNGYTQYIYAVSAPKKVRYKGHSKKKAYELLVTIQYQQLIQALKKEKIIRPLGF